MSLVALIEEVQMRRQRWGVQVTHSAPRIRKYVSMQRSYLQFTPLTPPTHTHMSDSTLLGISCDTLCVLYKEGGNVVLFASSMYCRTLPETLQKKIACTSYGSP